MTVPLSIILWFLGVGVTLIATIWGYLIWQLRELNKKKLDKETYKSDLNTTEEKFKQVALQVIKLEDKLEDSKTQNKEDHIMLYKQLEKTNNMLVDIHNCMLKLSSGKDCI